MRLKIGALTASALSVGARRLRLQQDHRTDSGGGDQKPNTQSGRRSRTTRTTTRRRRRPSTGRPRAARSASSRPADFEHLDPARSYVNVQQLAGLLLYRALNGYSEDGKGNLKVVGDLAENPGKDVNEDCKTWQFKLRHGVKYEDGTPGHRRTTSPTASRGRSRRTYPRARTTSSSGSPAAGLQRHYKGPYNGGAAVPPGVTVSRRPQTITFTFPKPHCDMPYAATMTTSGAGAQGQGHQAPSTTGGRSRPARTRSPRTPTDNSLVLERNPNWDANTDPLRNAYPDSIAVQLQAAGGPDRRAARRRRAAPTSPSLDLGGRAAGRAAQNDRSRRRRARGEGPDAVRLVPDINTQRIKDVNVRKALNYAVDKDALLKALGGSAAGTPATTLLSPTVAGYKKYDAFNAPGHR